MVSHTKVSNFVRETIGGNSNWLKRMFGIQFRWNIFSKANFAMKTLYQERLMGWSSFAF